MQLARVVSNGNLWLVLVLLGFKILSKRVSCYGSDGHVSSSSFSSQTRLLCQGQRISLPLDAIYEHHQSLSVRRLTNDRPDLSSESASHMDGTVTFNQNKYLVMSPRRGSTPRQTHWLTVSRKMTLTLTLSVRAVTDLSENLTVTYSTYLLREIST
jgi:hypothetical protein